MFMFLKNLRSILLPHLHLIICEQQYYSVIKLRLAIFTLQGWATAAHHSTTRLKCDTQKKFSSISGGFKCSSTIKYNVYIQ